MRSASRFRHDSPSIESADDARTWWWEVTGDSHKLTPTADGVRAWSFYLQALDDRLDSSDTTEPVTSLVPRFDLHVQSVRPAGAINRVQKGGSIIATISERIGRAGA